MGSLGMGYNSKMSFTSIEQRYLQMAGILSGLCIALVLARWAITGSDRYWFLIENLLLAFLALVFGWALANHLNSKRWSGWKAAFLSLLWLFFLPNSWYVLTDFIHVEKTAEISQLYDIGMVSTLVICGFLFGFTSLYLVHRQLLKRMIKSKAIAVVLGIILVASFAIYLGRDLRWNTWDILTDPGGLVLSVSDRLLDPFGNPRLLNVTSLFFVLISTIYLAIWQFLRRA